MGGFLGTTSLKKTDSPSLLSHQLPIAPRLGWDIVTSSPHTLGFCLGWTRAQSPPRVHACDCSVPCHQLSSPSSKIPQNN